MKFELLKIRNEYKTVRSKVLSSLFWICLIGIIILPLLIGVLYALPAADDFSHANASVAALKDSNIFVVACTSTKDIYMTWQGTFTSCFLMYIIEPFRTMGVMGIRGFLVLNLVVFFISVLWFGSKIVRNMFGVYDRNSFLILLTFFVFVSFGICDGGQEIFYWYTGACVYTVPMSLTFCSLALYMEFLWGEKRYRKRVWLCILAFIASGGVLQVTAILCYGMLILWVLFLAMNKGKEKILSGVPFISAFIGALINAFAPGNFARHAKMEEGIHIYKALINVAKVIILQIKGIIIENLFIYIMIFCFLLGILFASKSDMKKRKYHPTILLLILLFGLAISIFPFCLGCATIDMALRNTYICELYIGCGSIICALEFGGWVAAEKKCFINSEKLLLVFICIGLVFVRGGDVWKLIQGTSGRTFYELCRGDIQNCSTQWLKVLDEVRDSKEDDVIIQIEEIPSTILMEPGITEDKEYWVNYSVAQYYHKNTVMILKK